MDNFIGEMLSEESQLYLVDPEATISSLLASRLDTIIPTNTDQSLVRIPDACLEQSIFLTFCD